MIYAILNSQNYALFRVIELCKNSNEYLMKRSVTLEIKTVYNTFPKSRNNIHIYPIHYNLNFVDIKRKVVHLPSWSSPDFAFH